MVDKNIINTLDELYDKDIKKIIDLSNEDYKHLLLNELVNNQYKKIYNKEKATSACYIMIDLLAKENSEGIKDNYIKVNNIISKYNNKNDIYLIELNSLSNTIKFKKILNLLTDNISLDIEKEIINKVILNYLKKNIFIKLKLSEYNSLNNSIKNININEDIIEEYDKAIRLTFEDSFKPNYEAILDEILTSYKNPGLFSNVINYLKETINHLS